MKVVNYGSEFRGGVVAGKRLGIPEFATDPASPQDGNLWINTTDDALRFRTGGQTITLSSALDAEQVQDIVGAALVEGANVDIVYNDTAGTVTIAVTGLTSANISDFTTAARASITVADTATLDLEKSAGGVITGAVLDSPTVGGATAAQLRARSTHTGTQAPATIEFADTSRLLGRATAGAGTGEELSAAQAKAILGISAADISGLTESVQDTLGTTLVEGNNIDLVYDDTAGTLTVAVEALTSNDIGDFAEAAQDAVGGIVADTATLDLTYNDAANTLTGTVLDSPTVGGNTPESLRQRSTHTGRVAPGDILTQATSRLVGRVSASSGPSEELTPAQVKALLAIATGDIANFTADVVAAVNGASNIDADTLGGRTEADIATSITSGIVNGAEEALNTLAELAAALGGDENFAATVATQLGQRARYFTAVVPAASLVAGVADSIITHNLGTTLVQVQVHNHVTGWDEDFMVHHTSPNTITIRAEEVAIPAATYTVVITAAAPPPA